MSLYFIEQWFAVLEVLFCTRLLNGFGGYEHVYSPKADSTCMIGDTDIETRCVCVRFVINYYC